MGAQAELIRRGREADVVGPLVRALPGLSRYGRLCAVEVFGALPDPRADQPLIELLGSEDDTVREWAAIELADRSVHDAVPALRRALDASKSRNDSPDWTEPVALRSALTALGAKHPVVPPRTAELRVTTPFGSPAWPSQRLAEVLDDLAAHHQVTLYFQLWRRAATGQFHWTAHPTEDTALDFGKPWPDLVLDAHRRASAEASRVRPDEQVLVTIEWISQTDV